MEAVPYFSRGDGPVPRMRYWAAYKFVWTSRNGWRNLLLAAVCVLIPIVGLLVHIGYIRDVLVARLETLDDDSLGYPDFNFNQFGEYLQRGLWPFLVSLVASLVVMPVFFLLAFGAIFAVSLLRPPGPLLGIGIIILVLLVCAVALLLNLLMVPLVLRAAILEEFGPSFSWEWIMDFASRMWPEILLSILFQMITGVPLALIGYAVLFVGVYPAIALMTIAQWHMHFQIYRIYLSRGGAYVPPKPAAPYPPIGYAVQMPPPLPGRPPTT
jgi:hypothetical protein